MRSGRTVGLEKGFPGVTNGYFVDVGSGHGTIGSNSLGLELRGWTGICIDPFPIYMEGRTCRVFKEVVFSRPGLVMAFAQAGDSVVCPRRWELE